MSTGRSGNRQDYARLIERAHEIASAYLDSLPDRHVNARETADVLMERFGGALPEEPQDPVAVIDALVRDAERGLVASAGPRYFGFVIGGSFPVALAADWLTSAWDQNAGLHVTSPAVSAIEEVTRRWLVELFGLPAGASAGFVTAAHLANVTALAAARHEVLRRAGWDVEAHGLQGAPRVTVVAGAEAHSSIGAACRLLGLGESTVLRVDADDQGRMVPDALAASLEAVMGPLIVCAQSGNVNTGAFDPLEPIARITHRHGGWLHVDGAFGFWAAAVPALRHHHLSGVEQADSWATDAHKWLNVPYDSGIVLCAHPAAHRAAMSHTAAYLTQAENDLRDPLDWVPELSRRARSIPVYATLGALGRRGVQDLVTRCCSLASRMADRLRAEPGVTILNDVVLNQVLVRFDRRGEDVTPQVIAAVQQGGVCWAGGTTWQGQPAMRISISGWSTTEDDIDRSAEAIRSARRVLR